MVDSAVLQFKVDYEQTKQLPAGEAVHSDAVSAGGHTWRISCFPRGQTEADNGEYVSLFIARIGKTRSVKAIFEAFLMCSDGQTSTTITRRTLQAYDAKFSWGWSQFAKRSIVEKDYVTDQGHITFVCAIMVIDDSRIPVPPSDIGVDLGRLLDHMDGTSDVSFIVGGETFCVHRAVLAARSPVFRAELFGSMAEATMSSITLHDIAPATFRVMLQFMYTDALPGEDELGHSPVEMFQDLLAAADRYALDRLKFMCAQKLWDNMTVDTVATTLAYAETYNCPELKNKCIEFLAVEEHFKEAAFTDGYALLVLKFPSITAELKKKVRT